MSARRVPCSLAVGVLSPAEAIVNAAGLDFGVLPSVSARATALIMAETSKQFQRITTEKSVWYLRAE